jgi:DNA polymerase (family 10)
MIAVGDVRRFEPAVTSVDLLCVAPASEHRNALSAFTRLPVAFASRPISDQTVILGMDHGTLAVHMTTPDQAGAALVWHTGSPAHVFALRARADQRGLRYEDARLTDADDRVTRCPSEDDLYDQLDLPFIAPELRAGPRKSKRPNAMPCPHSSSSAIFAATSTCTRHGVMAATPSSDGARQPTARLRIHCDHGSFQRAWSSRKLALEDVPRQREEIETLRSKIAGITILHGVEVDILCDGTLDFDDEVLAASTLCSRRFTTPANRTDRS